MDSAELVEAISKRASTASLNELYAGIAVELPASEREGTAAGASLKVTDIVAVGRTFYLRRIRPSIKDLICGELEYCRNRGRYETAASITGMVAEEAGKAIAQAGGFPAGAGGTIGKLLVDVSAAVLKEGLNELCGCRE